MADRKDIKKAKDKIDRIIDMGKQLQKSTPFLLNIKSNLDLYEETCDTIPEKENDIIAPITGSIQDILSLDYLNINVPTCSGIEASFISASAAETRYTILSSDSQNHYLLNKFNDIYKTDNLITEISNKLNLIDSTLCIELNEANNCYSHWQSGLKTNSDLAKDTRTFLEHFKGTINKLRVPKTDWGKVKIPEMSWPKMVEKISKNGSENKKAFEKQKKIGEDIWQELTNIMKKSFDVEKENMDSLFKRCIEHVYAVLNLIDEKILNQ